MKKLFFVLLCIVVCFSVYSEDFKSNSLGQKLGTATEGDEYILSQNGNESVLIRNGERIRKYTDTVEKKTRIISEEDLINGGIITKKYENGLLVEQHILTDLTDEKTVFTYENNSLIMSTITRNGETTAEYYMRSASDGRLIGTRTFSNGYNIVGSTYLIEGDTLYRQYGSKLVFDDEIEVSKDGLLKVKSDSGESVYNSQGFIVSSLKDGIQFEYFYDENNVLIREVQTAKKGKTESVYNNGELISSDYYESNDLKYTTRYTDKQYGSVRTILRNGVEIADVYYDFDNIKILKIEYRD